MDESKKGAEDVVASGLYRLAIDGPTNVALLAQVGDMPLDTLMAVLITAQALGAAELYRKQFEDKVKTVVKVGNEWRLTWGPTALMVRDVREDKW